MSDISTSSCGIGKDNNMFFLLFFLLLFNKDGCGCGDGFGDNSLFFFLLIFLVLLGPGCKF